MATEATQTPQSLDRTQARILIVDDQETNRMILERRLRMDNFSEIAQAADGREALTQLERAPFDAVLLDMIMPEMGGYEALCAIKQNPDLQHIPVIMISAEDDIKKIVQCIQAGAEDYLGKPFNPTLLRARLNASLDKKILRDKEKQYQEQMLSQQKLASLGALTEGIAQELKNPLHFVINFAEISMDVANEIEQHATIPSTAEAAGDFARKTKILQANISKIVEHGKRADGIIRFMLDHSRVSGAKLQAGNVNKLLEECVTMAFAAHKSRYTIFNVKINKEFDKGIQFIDFAWQDLAHVIVNIIDNALYATCEKAESLTALRDKNKDSSTETAFVPQITLSTTDKEATVDIIIQDNGVGISKENVKKICDPFFTTKSNGDGTGLGLSMMQTIITLGHQGKYTIDSIEGEGTTFCISLPKKR
ncbi:MAG: response regulator [Holosporales bacterium]|jgi:signal transduction histidine kinase|nr:response regulator [Holosporales bacterium]